MENYEEKVNKVREMNNSLVNGFQADMESKGLSINTQRIHLFNVKFFIYEYLLREEDIYTPEAGWFMMDEYFSYFYIYKCSWSNVHKLKTTITSFKKFYLCLLEANKISDKVHSEFLTMIKDNKDKWIGKLKKAEASMDVQSKKLDEVKRFLRD